MKLAVLDEEGLVKSIGADMMPIIKTTASSTVREIILTGNKRGVPLAQMPYLFWALDNQQSLPDLGNLQPYYQLMIDMMDRTGVMPDYQKKFSLPDDSGVDSAVDAVALDMAKWALRTMLPALSAGYVRVLGSHVSKVHEVTQGRVPVKNGPAYLNTLFRQILNMRSIWFEDGELLRRVMRLLPG